VRRLHANAGHRSGARLAPALVICGAPKEAVLAANHLKCDACSERRAPKARHPATFPAVHDFGAQLQVNILVVEDAFQQTYLVGQATDKVSRYQLAVLLPNKSSAAMINFITTHWVPLLGAPQISRPGEGVHQP